MDYHDLRASPVNDVYRASNLQAGQYYNVRFKIDTPVGNFYGDTALTILPTGILVVSGQFNDMSIYPNPASNYLAIALKAGLSSESTIQLFDLNGQQVKEIKMSAGR